MQKSTDAALGALPAWDLRDLYPAPDSPALEADLARIEAEARAFRERLMGRLDALDGDGLADAIAACEGMSDVMGRIMSYAQLVHAGDLMDPAIGKFYQAMQ